MRGLHTSVCALALIAATSAGVPALAQEATSAGAPQEQNAGAQGLQDIVVTAQRRSERLQKVPIAVTAVTPETMQTLGLKDISSIQIVTPGLSISSDFNYAQTFIRGVGANFSNPGVENPVAVYMDGAYLERSKGGNLDVTDIASLQVLKGPQGTLWGRNATGGAILVNTADPEHHLGARLMGEIGSLGRRSIEGMLNVPLSDSVALRVSGRYRHDDGYLRNLPDDYMYGWSTNKQVRAKLLFEPSSNFSAIGEFQYTKNESATIAGSQFLPAGFCLGCSQTGYTYPLDPYTTAVNRVNGGPQVLNSDYFYNLKLRYDAGPITLTSVTAYDDFNDVNYWDSDYTTVRDPAQGALHFRIPSSNKTFTQSFNATTDFGGALEAQAGVDYLNDRSTYALYNVAPVLVAPYPPANLAYVKTESISPYVEANFKPIDGLTLTAGGRYTKDVRHGRRAGEPNQRYSEDGFSPRFVIAYDFGHLNAYVSYNKGFKSGGFSTPAIPMQAFLPETLHGYEAGLKFVSADRRLRANIAGFVYNYKQVQTVAIDQNSSNVGITQNPDAKIHGVDFDFNWEPNDVLKLFGGGSFLHSEYRNYRNAGVQVPVYDAAGNPAGLTTGTVDLSGTRLPHAPSFSAFLGVTLTHELWSGWTGQLTGLVNHSSSFDFFPDGGGPLHADVQPAYTVARISGSIKPNDGPYEIGFYVENLTDELYYTQRFTAAPFGAAQIAARPRTYGLRFTVTY